MLSNRPVTCVVGDFFQADGRTYICSAINTWTRTE